jgi:HEAT repeat protein
MISLRARARARAEDEVRPILFEALDGDVVDPGTLQGLTRSRQRALDALVRDLLPNVRGPDKEVLVGLLERQGGVEAARRQSRSKRASVRLRAGGILADAGSEDATAGLLALLHDVNPQVRWSAARGLGRLGNPNALSPLLATLEGPRPLPVDVVADAIFEIRNCPVSVLRQGLKSRSVATRAVTVELLGRFQALAAADDVLGLLQHDPSVEVRARAARCLGRMGTPRTVDPLIECLDDGPVAMRIQAIWALGEIGAPEAVPALRLVVLEGPHQMAEPAALALLAIGAFGIQVLAQIAQDGGQSAVLAAEVLASRSDLEPALP